MTTMPRRGFFQFGVLKGTRRCLKSPNTVGQYLLLKTRQVNWWPGGSCLPAPCAKIQVAFIVIVGIFVAAAVVFVVVEFVEVVIIVKFVEIVVEFVEIVVEFVEIVVAVVTVAGVVPSVADFVLLLLLSF
jgi:hypothetical protein